MPTPRRGYCARLESADFLRSQVEGAGQRGGEGAESVGGMVRVFMEGVERRAVAGLPSPPTNSASVPPPHAVCAGRVVAPHQGGPRAQPGTGEWRCGVAEMMKHRRTHDESLIAGPGAQATGAGEGWSAFRGDASTGAIHCGWLPGRDRLHGDSTSE